MCRSVKTFGRISFVTVMLRDFVLLIMFFVTIYEVKRLNKLSLLTHENIVAMWTSILSHCKSHLFSCIVYNYSGFLQGCKIATSHKRLINQALELRVFGYNQSDTSEELDSFHYYLRALTMRVSIWFFYNSNIIMCCISSNHRACPV